ncbi:MAG: NAD(P)-dependent alcohol dehydrogenase [Lewinellaceae bacterium]|nr:NAD(P)-dependent alcohol dehydrogenase [Lewinellaceae bacterium]
MQASVYRAYGPPDVLQLETVEKPTPKANEIRVRIHAATVNRTDCAMLLAKPFIMRFFTGLFRPRKPILGTDFAGTVEAVGADVTGFKVGDRVFGFDDNGLSSHAEYLTIDTAKGIAAIPENCSYEQATASIEGAHYAYNFINKVQLHPGDKVLVNGASGAIGSAAVQLLKYYGAVVTAVCNTKNIDMAKAIGADRVIDYLREDFTKDDQQYDFVFDAVGKSSFNKCKPLLKPGGTYISSELGWMAQNLFYAVFTPFFSRKKVKFPVPVDIPGSVRLVGKMMAEGKFKPVIDRTYTLAETAEAFRYVLTGEKTGNVVLHITANR